MSNRHWLETAEYTSLAASAIGSIAATVSQQVVFAVAPISVSLALGTLNRNHLQQQAQQTAQVAITQVDQQFKGQIESVQQQLKALPAPPDPFDPTELEAQIARTQAALSKLQRDAEASVTEIRQYLDSKLESLQAQLQTELSQIPPAFDPSYLEAKIEQGGSAISQFSEGLAAVQACLIPLQAINLKPLQQEVSQLQKNIQTQAQGSEARSALLQEQLRQLTEQISKLEHINRTVIQSHISELTAKLKPTAEATASLSKQLATLSNQVNTKAEHQKVAELTDSLKRLQQQLEQLPPPLQPFDPAPLQADINGLQSRTIDLQEQVQEVRLLVKELSMDERLEQARNAITNLEQKSQEFLTRQELAPWQQTIIESFEHGLSSLKLELVMLNQAFAERPEQSLAQRAEELQQQIQALEGWLKGLDTSFEEVQDRTRNLDVMQQQIEGLVTVTEKSSELEIALARLSEEFSGRIDDAIEGHLSDLRKLLSDIESTYSYELVFDRSHSRSFLMQALETSQRHLIMVCPWPSKYSIDSTVLQKLRILLRNGVQIDIGWGNLRDIDKGELGIGWKYSALQKLRKLAEEYPGRLRLKLLGTHEKFLVSDLNFALVGSHNFLSSSDSSSEREAGVYTTDPRIVNGLVKRFETAKDLGQQTPEKFSA